MGNIFHVYAAQGRNSYAELDLPASDYEMLDLMERLHLKPGQLPYVEILEVREQYDYLEPCIHELPDIYQLNALAKKLAEFTNTQDMAAFEGLVGKELESGPHPIPIPWLIDFAYSTESCALADGVMTDFQLGKFLVENEFIEEANGLTESMIALLDFGRIGREYRESDGGVFTGFGYVEQLLEVQHISGTMDFRPGKPAYTILVNMAALPLTEEGRKRDMLQLRLPAPEAQVQEALDRLGAKDWNSVAVSILDCPIPRLNHEVYLNGEMPQIAELAQCLQQLDARGEMTRYKAVLEASDGKELSQALSLARRMDEYILSPQIRSVGDMARSELKVLLGEANARDLEPYVDLTAYGCALLTRDNALLTGYGLVERVDGQPIQAMEDQPRQGGMKMEM